MRGKKAFTFPTTIHRIKPIPFAGELKQVEEISKILREKGADVRLLKLNLPFHTPLLSDAIEPFAEALNSIEISLPKVPVISNVTALPYKSVAEIRQLLSIQISRPVKWQQTMEFMIREEITHAFEFGPKTILKQFFQDSFPKVPCLSIESNIEDYSLSTEKGSKDKISKALCILASTRNHDGANKNSTRRIQEINQEFKQEGSSSRMMETQILELLREALELKKTADSDIRAYLSQLLDKVQFFSFPYAGGDAGIFKGWNEKLDKRIDLIPLEYPGRGKKPKYPCAKDLDELLDHLEKEILPSIKPPFVFFGHSLGAIVAFEMAARVLKVRNQSPSF